MSDLTIDLTPTEKAIKAAYSEGWSDYHVFQNPQRGTKQNFAKCWDESEAKIKSSEYSK